MNRIRGEVLAQIDLSRDISDEELRRLIHEQIQKEAREEYIPLSERNRIGKGVFNSLRKLDFIQDLLENEEITEIMINGPDSIFTEQSGAVKKEDLRFENREKLEDMIQQIVSSCNRTVNEKDPIADARLADGCRVNIVLSPPAIEGPVVTIRRFPKKEITMKDFIQWGTISKEAADFLQAAVTGGSNIFVSGGTSSGKTTMLNVLSGFIPKNLRVICIEDSAELRITHIPNLIRLETRNSTAEGCEDITIRDLIRCSLRMRPDRLIIGEVRGAEAMDMLQAFNTGHEGSMSTGHANTAEDMLLRLEAMVLMGTKLPIGAIRRQISTGIDLIVHLSRQRNGQRRVEQIIEILGISGEEIKKNVLFDLQPDSDGVPVLKKMNEPKKTKHLQGYRKAE
ncbi:MAG: CpaF family protein [Lachnospiraceae bacterium]|nr:CpaF family protein [Lachnospiraceae bacterium]